VDDRVLGVSGVVSSPRQIKCPVWALTEIFPMRNDLLGAQASVDWAVAQIPILDQRLMTWKRSSPYEIVMEAGYQRQRAPEFAPQGRTWMTPTAALGRHMPRLQSCLAVRPKPYASARAAARVVEAYPEHDLRHSHATQLLVAGIHPKGYRNCYRTRYHGSRQAAAPVARCFMSARPRRQAAMADPPDKIANCPAGGL
jgi:hypothetical protein